MSVCKAFNLAVVLSMGILGVAGAVLAIFDGAFVEGMLATLFISPYFMLTALALVCA